MNGGFESWNRALLFNFYFLGVEFLTDPRDRPAVTEVRHSPSATLLSLQEEL